jgi:hypothetical protein
MSETETAIETPSPKPAKKKQARKKPARKFIKRGMQTADPVVLKNDGFPGLTQNDCSTTCTAVRCAISGANYCGHPCKGAMTPPGDVAALNRLRSAQKQLGIEKVEKRYA